MNLILHKILKDKNLEVWSKLRKEFFQPPYSEIFYLINKFYKKFDKLPSFEELQIVTRDEKLVNFISALSLIDVPEDLDIEVILEALINEYSQTKVLDKLSSYIGEIVYKDAEEIIEHLSQIALDIEEEVRNDEQIVLMTDYMTIDTDTIELRVPLGINNEFDRISLGMSPEEYLMIGGYRGSGKTVVCTNIVCNQHEQGFASIYFTIEMKGRELYERNMSILSGVESKLIRAGTLSHEQKSRIVKVRANMTEDGSEDLVEKFLSDRDFDSFEKQLIRRPAKKEGSIITVDNASLTLANIDATVGKYKTILGDNLRVVVVDYINQIEMTDPYDWKNQIFASKRLKAIARKHQIIMVSPFQITEDGKVRYSKGIHDAPDVVYNLEAVKEGPTGGHISFENKKIRGDAPIDFQSEVHWPCTKIIPSETLMLPTAEAGETEDDLKI